MKKLTMEERKLVELINHPIYTVDNIEYYLNLETNVVVNAPLSLMAMSADGFYSCVKQILKREIIVF